jgi:hypothetical protein
MIRLHFDVLLSRFVFEHLVSSLSYRFGPIPVYQARDSCPYRRFCMADGFFAERGSCPVC